MHASDCFQGIGQVKAKNILSDMSEDERFAIVNGYTKPEAGFEKTPQFRSMNKTAQSFIKGLRPFYDFVAQNKLKVLPMSTPIKAIGDKYAGMKVCFTGIRDKELEDSILSQGGEIVNSVSKKTTHLVVGDIHSTSSKTAKAKSLNIPIYTVDQFMTL